MKAFAEGHAWALLIVIPPMAWLLCKAWRWMARAWKDMDEDLEEYRYYLRKQEPRVLNGADTGPADEKPGQAPGGGCQ